VISEICVDANVQVKWYTAEEFRDQATALADECFDLGVELIAPEVFFAEVSSAIRRKVHRKLMLPSEGLLAVGILSRSEITPYSLKDLYQGAWRIAETYNLPTLYDAYYLALAEQRECDFWTADERLANATGGLPYIKLIRDYAPGQLGG
jgi:predicted nucleic acid-binding protein